MAMGWPLGQRFIPPTDICICVYVCISTSRPGSRRFVLAEETIEERRPVAEGSNGSTWFSARNWVTGEAIGYTLFVADRCHYPK